MALRFLVVEGNTRPARKRHAASYGVTPAQSYAAVLQEIEPDIFCDIAHPADEGANLPDPAGLEAYDRIVLTGSALNIYDLGPEVTRQIELMRAVYASGRPAFGSCWGIQVGAVAAGGEVKKNPLGREVGFARNITLSDAGRVHPMLAGRPAAYDAPAIHLDIIAAPPDDCTVLAANRMAGIQAAEIRVNGGALWAVQYHPEFSLAEIGTILDSHRQMLVNEGFCATLEEAAAYAAELKALHADPSRRDLAWRHGLDGEVLDPVRRTTEIRNFVNHWVKPAKSRRGRA
jgi:GMP synthase (glutamine-hydrolysing)